MADSKITALTSISTSSDPANDPLVIVDVSDTSMAATGTTKKVTLNQLLACSPTATLASATITGDLTAARLIVTGGTIPTNGLWLPTTNTLEFAANSLAQYRIAPLGVFSWYDGAGGTRMTLNSTGLGLGTASPGYKLVVAAASGNVMQFENTSDSSRGGRITNTGTAGTGKFGITTTSSGYGLSFGIDAVEKMLLDTSGNVGVGVTPSASGGCLQLKSGITFPATQVASSDANTLDDYEEGTFTATLKGGTADPTTPVTTTGRYTKIGRLVSIQLLFNNVATTGASGSISVSGLPFSSASSIYNSGSAVSGDMATFTGTLGCWLPPSSSTIDVISSASNGSVSGATHNAGTSRYLAININYTV